MKRFLLGVWHWHGIIGKICTIIVIAAILSGLVGLAFGVTKCKQENELIYSDTFLNEEIIVHDNYTIIVNSAKTVDSISTLNKKGETEIETGRFISVNLTISQKTDGSIDGHKLDCNDFKMKDHTGTYIPLNKIGSLVGWDMIDLHIDSAKNGFVISSADFRTQNAIKDYSFYNKTIVPGDSYNINIFFEMKKNYYVESEIMVLEIDFLGGWWGNHKGEDIILLPRPTYFVE